MNFKYKINYNYKIQRILQRKLFKKFYKTMRYENITFFFKIQK